MSAERGTSPFAVGAETSGGPAGNLLRAVRTLIASLLAIAQTRMELLSTEIEEEWLRLVTLLVIGLAGLFCLSLATMLAVALIVAAFWEQHRLLTIGLLTLCFALVGAGLLRAMVLRYRAKPRLFSASLDELGKDHERLTLGEL